ncbi:hypothetical protein CEUSTIGMA_g12396.t1 [Chlamydomonas eustigma]|uniref:ATPase AAA-type core domain-containing protein n=1 Tax=Chlamydomonas eustigma TaxID=1157962 RepID=A0A250XPH7_9CHLO|nr:hypothetical protein CEUSTIGMA_g12396.t1 [Chlamydomonas eustigma]|eukprot:GAX84975.1 hypothetical protein CEUSTIGMA_g12396.t1 [Chlamydomonas eustigma]
MIKKNIVMFEAIEHLRCKLLGLSRKDLQSKAKCLGVPANLKSADIVEQILEVSSSNENKALPTTGAPQMMSGHPTSIPLRENSAALNQQPLSVSGSQCIHISKLQGQVHDSSQKEVGTIEQGVTRNEAEKRVHQPSGAPLIEPLRRNVILSGSAAPLASALASAALRAASPAVPSDRPSVMSLGASEFPPGVSPVTKAGAYGFVGAPPAGARPETKADKLTLTGAQPIGRPETKASAYGFVGAPPGASPETSRSSASRFKLVSPYRQRPAIGHRPASPSCLPQTTSLNIPPPAANSMLSPQGHRPGSAAANMRHGHSTAQAVSAQREGMLSPVRRAATPPPRQPASITGIAPRSPHLPVNISKQSRAPPPAGHPTSKPGWSSGTSAVAQPSASPLRLGRSNQGLLPKPCDPVDLSLMSPLRSTNGTSSATYRVPLSPLMSPLNRAPARRVAVAADAHGSKIVATAAASAVARTGSGNDGTLGAVAADAHGSKIVATAATSAVARTGSGNDGTLGAVDVSVNAAIKGVRIQDSSAGCDEVDIAFYDELVQSDMVVKQKGDGMMKHVIGMNSIKQHLLDVVCFQNEDPQLQQSTGRQHNYTNNKRQAGPISYADYNLPDASLLKPVLLYGPPGVGKTLMARSLAAEVVAAKHAPTSLLPSSEEREVPNSKQAVHGGGDSKPGGRGATAAVGSNQQKQSNNCQHGICSTADLNMYVDLAQLVAEHGRQADKMMHAIFRALLSDAPNTADHLRPSALVMDNLQVIQEQQRLDLDKAEAACRLRSAILSGFRDLSVLHSSRQDNSSKATALPCTSNQQPVVSSSSALTAAAGSSRSVATEALLAGAAGGSKGSKRWRPRQQQQQQKVPPVSSTTAAVPAGAAALGTGAQFCCGRMSPLVIFGVAGGKAGSVDDDLARCFTHSKVYLSLPDPDTRESLLFMALASKEAALSVNDIVELVRCTEGLSQGDIIKVCQKAESLASLTFHNYDNINTLNKTAKEGCFHELKSSKPSSSQTRMTATADGRSSDCQENSIGATADGSPKLYDETASTPKIMMSHFEAALQDARNCLLDQSGAVAYLKWKAHLSAL